MARAGNGTRCSFSPLIRSAGITHSFFPNEEKYNIHTGFMADFYGYGEFTDLKKIISDEKETEGWGLEFPVAEVRLGGAQDAQVEIERGYQLGALADLFELLRVVFGKLQQDAVGGQARYTGELQDVRKRRVVGGRHDRPHVDGRPEKFIALD